MGYGRPWRQQIRAAGHVLIANERFSMLSTTRGRYQGRRSPKSPIILHVQEPEGVIVGILPIANLLIPWKKTTVIGLTPGWPRR